MKKILMTVLIFFTTSITQAYALDPPTVCTGRSTDNVCTIWRYYSGITGYKIGNFWGFYDSNGRGIVHPVYTALAAFENNQIQVWRGMSTTGILDTSGNVIVPVQYIEIKTERNNYRTRNDKSLYGLRSPDGTVLCDEIYNSISTLGEYLFLIEKNRLYGAMNQDGKIIISPQYSRIKEMRHTINSNSYFWVWPTQGPWKIIDINNKTVFETPYSDINMIGPTHFEFKVGKKYGIIDTKGKTIVQPIYDKIDNGVNGFYKIKTNGKWGAVDTFGTVVIPCTKGPIEITNAIKNYPATQKHAIQVNINNAYASLNAAKVLYYSGQTDFARERFNIFLANSNISESEKNKYRALAQQAPVYRKTITTGFQDLYNKAESCYNNMQYTQAVSYLNQIIDGSNVDKNILHSAYNLRYVIKMYNLNDESGAAKDYKKVLELENSST